ncbi:flagellar biosynthesis anti-sigma factor FlgM [Bacillus sp. BGMRC 2118]|nr:flagellar biosynthesis anti-sigma factor FlgM [Bacillus sp. BGMRC 2118]
MKINNLGPINVNPYKKNMSKVDNLPKSQSKTDKVEISSAALELRQNSKVVMDRAERVEALRHQVEAGTYSVDAESVAKSVIQYFKNN